MGFIILNIMQDSVKSILSLLRLAERMKFELRHSWLSSGRQESVAEHTWQMRRLK